MAADGGKEIKGAKGGQSSSRTPVEAPDSLNSIATANILDLLGEGELAGWYSNDALKDIFLDETPIMNEDGTMNFSNVQVDWREGTQSQSYIPGFPAVENEIAVGVELKQSATWTKAISNTTLSAVRVRLSVLALSKTNTSNGDISGHSVVYAIDLATDGGAFVTVLNNAFSGKTNAKYERTHRIDLPTATTGWTVRVRRLTADTEDAQIQDTTMVESYTEIIDVKLRYPNSALVGIKIDASQFRNIPTRAFRKLGRLMRIPSNYNPVTRVYTGVWDGTFQLAWTNNPAWIFYDLVTNDRFGLGEYVDETQIDKWALYNIGQYCDELVPDGKGGTEPRFTCTVYFQRQEEAYKVLQDLASVFRGISYWGNGAVIPVGDLPRDPVYTYTNANVKEGKFSYQGSTRRARHTVALVSWSDPEDFNRLKVEYVPDPEGIARYGIQETQITAVGCTSQGQAQRVGRWLLITERVETDTVTFAVGLDGVLALPGDVIRVADSRRAGRRTGGRIANATANVITPDQMPTVAIGDDLTCILPTGVAQTRPVSAVGGGTITVSPAFTAVPPPESVWTVESASLKNQLFTVISVGEGEGLTAVITALQHEPGKFDAVDNGTKIEPRSITDIQSPVQKPVTNLVVTQRDRAGEVTVSQLITAKWTAAANAVGYNVQWRRENGEWSSPQRVLGNSAELYNAFPGDYVCKVQALNGLGVLSVPTVSETFTVLDQSLTPGFVDALNADIAEALLTAENAAAVADGAVVSFWQDSAPVIGSGAGQAKVGDIWFDTNDGNRIWRVVGAAWVDAQDDDLALALASASTAQATADGKVKTFFAATAPTAEAIGDLWFNTVTKKLFRWSGTDWNSEIADVTLDQLGGNGVNLQDDKFVSFGDLPPTSGSSNANSVTIDLTEKIHDGSLKLVWNATGSAWYYFGPLAGSMYLTPGKYIVSAWIRHNVVAGLQVRFGLRAGVGGAQATSSYETITPANNWQRHSFVVDISALTEGKYALLFDPEDTGGKTVYIDGVMVEAMVGRLNQPSPFVRGDSLTKALDALAAAIAAQDTADGKIETYFQAAMPTGASLGDLWFDTDDGNKVWRHNGTTFVECQDDDIAQAILDAAGAQATADGKVTTFYSASTPTAEGTGDLWVNTTSKLVSRWSGSSWVTIADITADKLAGNGVNMLWEEYSMLQQAQTSLSDPLKSIPICNSAGLTTLETVANSAAQGGYEFHAVTGTTAPGSDYFRLAESATDNNLTVEGRKYIMSFWARSTTAGHQMRPWIRGTNVIDGTILALTTTRTRYSVVFNCAAGGAQFGFFCNTSGVAGRHVYIDGVMVEPAIGNDTSPSPYAPGPSARNMWRALTNANNLTNGRNLVLNPNITSNMIGAATAGYATGDNICDNWYAGLIHPAFTHQRTDGGRATGGYELVMYLGNAGTAIANGATARSIMGTKRRWPVIAGEKFNASAWLKADFNHTPTAGVTMTLYLRCAFYDTDGTFISYGETTVPRAGGYIKYTVPTMTAPAGAAFMDIRLDFQVANASGAAYSCPAGQFDWIIQATEFEVYKVTDMDDDVSNGVNYGRVSNLDLYDDSGFRRIGLRRSGSGHRLGSQRNIPRSNTSAYGMVRTTTALSANSSGQVTVNAHTVRYGSHSATYNAVSNAVTGLTVGTTYVIYCSDPDLTGGTKTYFAGVDPATVMNISDDIYVVGQIQIPSSGSSSGGGGGTGDPGDWCVDWDTVLPDGRYLRDLRMGEMAECIDVKTGERGFYPLLGMGYGEEECYRLVTPGLASIIQSKSTPMDLPNGATCKTPDMFGKPVWHKIDGVDELTHVNDLQYLGMRRVLKPDFGNRMFYAGESARATIATHNAIHKP